MIRGTADTPSDLVEDYLDRLLVCISGSPRQVRHTLAEVEEHLRDAVAEGVAEGLPEPEAQARAVARMGPVTAVAGRRAPVTRPSLGLVRRLVLTAALVGSGGLVAIGAAGLIDRVLAAARGNLFVTAPWPPGTYSRSDCARWLAGDPRTHSCVTAMLADHAWDFLMETATIGLLGLLGTGLYLVLRQRWRDRATLTALPDGAAQLTGAVLAGLAAIFFFGQVIDIENVQHGIGAGQPLSLGIAAAAASAVFGLWLARAVRARA
jgi:hypothetical protein